MIISFACRDTEKLFQDKLVKRFHSISRQVQIKLAFLDAASNINELRSPPGNIVNHLILGVISTSSFNF